MPKIQSRFKSRIKPSPKIPSRSQRAPSSSSVSGWLLIQRLSVALVGLVIVIVVVGGSVVWRSRKWDGQERLNIVLVQSIDDSNHQLTLLSFDGHQKQTVAMRIPTNLKIRPLGSEEEVIISHLLRWYQDQGKDERYFFATLAYYFGFVSRDIVEIPATISLSTKVDFQKKLHLGVLKDATGSLSLIDRLMIGRHLSESSQVVTFDQQVSPNIFVQHSDGLMLDISQTYQNFTMVLNDRSLQKRNITVAVVNTTQFSGIASTMGNILSATGYRVINVSSEDTALEKSQLYVSPKLAGEAELFYPVLSMFPEDVSVEVAKGITDQYRSDLVLLVGQDAAVFPEKKR